MTFQDIKTPPRFVHYSDVDLLPGSWSNRLAPLRGESAQEEKAPRKAGLALASAMLSAARSRFFAPNQPVDVREIVRDRDLPGHSQDGGHGSQKRSSGD